MFPRIQKLLQVIDFIVPFDVLIAVVVVFSLENYVDHAVQQYAPTAPPELWLLFAGVGLILFGLFRYVTATDDEFDELEDELEDIENGT